MDHHSQMKFIHLTDSHLVAPPQSLFEMNMGARLKGAIRSIIEHHRDASFCVVTGDLTHWGEVGAFELFRNTMNELPIPWHAIPGNHDLRSVFSMILPDTPVTQNGFIQYGLDTPQGRFVFLDTVDEGKSSGFLCSDRLGWLKSELEYAEKSETDVYLFMHHAPMPIGINGVDRIRLTNGDEFSDLVSRFKNIRHLFFGHVHRPCHGVWRGLPFSTVKATAHQIAFTLDPDDPLISSREDPAYAVVLIDQDGVIIHDYSYFDEDKAFIYERGAPEGSGEKPAHQKDWD